LPAPEKVHHARHGNAENAGFPLPHVRVIRPTESTKLR